MNALTLLVLLSVHVTKSYSEGVLFLETFQEDVFVMGRWQKSSKEDLRDQPVVIKPSKNPGKGFEHDTALELTQAMKKYSLGSKFPSPIDPKGKDFVIQYETKFEDLVTCGGAYLKLLRQDGELDITEMDSSTPYSIMFGPDKCGHDTNKVHFILNHQNPLTKTWEEKHFENAPQIKNDRKTHLYTLHISSNNSFEIFIDKESVSKGNLLTDMTPPVNPPAEIDDPTDVKPSDWVDEEEIPDATATKPDDWDESAPLMIEDETDTKPADWLDDAPEMIADPTAQRPDDWDDEEDGVWEAPTVPNPACEKASGCGPWSRRQVKNPDYKGKWRAPMIPNPAYKGVWKARQIPNPNYFYDPNPAAFHPIGGVGIEVWTIDSGYRFDNILIATSIGDAFRYADSSFVPKQTAEKTIVDPEDVEETPVEADWKSVAYWRYLAMGHYKNVLKMMEDNPFVVQIGGTVLLSSVIVWVVIFGSALFRPSAKPPAAATPTTPATPVSSATPAVTAAATPSPSPAAVEDKTENKASASADDEDTPAPNSPTSRRKKTPKAT